MSNYNLLKYYLDKSIRNSRIKNIIKKNEIIIRCNLCGDGSDKSNMRGHFKLADGKTGKFWYYKCFNEGCRANNKSLPAEKWLKNHSKSDYNQYIQDMFSKEKKELSEEESKSFEEEKYNEEEDTKHFKSLIKSKSNLAKTGIEYCISRKIPKEIYSKWFVSLGGRYKDRLIIPFYDSNDEIYYYQARALTDVNPKYINRKAEKKNCLYNIFNIDKTKPVIITEGPIDSMFLENSIATLGVEITPSDKKELEKLKSYYLMDNDSTGRRLSEKYIKKGHYVFLWSKFLRENNYPKVKDINELILKIDKDRFTFKELEPYFSNHIFDILHLRGTK